MTFTEENYTYGPDHMGFPPNLSECGKVKVCRLETPEELDAAKTATELMRKVLGDHRPDVDIVWREEEDSIRNDLILETYFMQAFGHKRHVLYKAAVSKSSKKFRNAVRRMQK